MGIPPEAADPLSLRQLDLMARGRSGDGWRRTLELMALVANCNRDRKVRRRPFVASEFAAELGLWWLGYADAPRRKPKPAGPAEIALLEKLFPPRG